MNNEVIAVKPESIYFGLVTSGFHRKNIYTVAYSADMLY